MPDTAQMVSVVKGALFATQEGLKGIGIPGVESVAGMPLLLIKCYENLAKNKEDLITLLGSFKTLHEVMLAPMKEAREEHLHISDDDYRRIDDLKTSLHACINALLPLTYLKWRARLWRQEAIASVLQTCRITTLDAITKFKLQGQITVHRLIRDLHNRAILDTLNPDLNAPSDASYKPACLAGTRSDLLNDILQELTKPEILFVSLLGSPGTGKSAVARSIAIELKKQRRLAASYFFDKNRKRSDAPMRVFLSTIIHQLAYSYPTYGSTVIRRLESDPSLASQTEVNQLQELVLEPFKLIPPPKQQRTVIVIDALDECGDRLQQEALVNLLARCEVLRSHIIFFLTCRPEAPFLSWLDDTKPGGLIAVQKMDELDESQTIQDVEKVVDAELKRFQNSEQSDLSASPQPFPIEELARLTGGLFELAAIWLRQIHAHLVNRSLPEAIDTVLVNARSLPTAPSLRTVYKTILERAYPPPSASSYAAGDLGEYHRVVGALVALREPLDIASFAALLGMKLADTRARLKPLTSVIDVSDGGPLRFYHATFRESLLSKSQTPPSDADIPHEYLIDSSQADATLAFRSLVTMNESNALRRNPLDLPDPCILNEAILDLPGLLDQVISRHLRYACLYWADHLRAEHSSPCHAPLVQWCEEKIIFYLEALSLLGEIERAVPLLLNAEDWARKVDIQASTVTLLYDARRLIPAFHAAITQSAGAVYTSAIPFMPDCTLRGHYSHLAHECAEVIRGRLSQWSSQIWAEEYISPVACVAVSPGGRYVASARGNDVRILSASTGKVEQTLQGHRAQVCAVAFSSDGERVVSGSQYGSLGVWLSATGELEKRIKGHRQLIQSVAFSPDDLQVVSGSEDNTVRIWSVATGEQERASEGHTHAVHTVAFSPTGLYIVSGSRDKTVRIWSTVTGAQEKILTGHSDVVQSVAVSFDGTRIVSGSDDRSVRIWFAATGTTEWVLKPQPAGRINSVALSPDGEHVVSAMDDCTIRVWSTITGAEERVLKGYRDRVTSVAFFPDGKHIASGSLDWSVRVWSISSNAREPTLNGHIRRVNSVAFSADGASLVSASDDCSLRVWSTLTGAQEQILEGHAMPIRSASFSMDGLHVVSGSEDCSIHVWSTVTGARERVLWGHDKTVLTVAFSPDGDHIVSGSEDRSVRVWSVATGEQEQLLNSKTPTEGLDNWSERVLSVGFSSDGAHIISGMRNRFVRVWNATTGAQEKQLLAPDGTRVDTVLFAWNDQIVGCVDVHGIAAYWDVSSGLALDCDDPRIPLQPWIKNGHHCAAHGWLTVNGHTFWVPRYVHGRWWSHPSGVVILAPYDSEGKLVFIRLPSRT